MSDIVIEGLDALERKLGRLRAVEVLRIPMAQSVHLLHGAVQDYPPASGRKMKWKSAKQRRWFFANLREGNIVIPYRRRKSGGLAGSWVARVEASPRTLTGIVTSKISYGPLVMHPQRQADYHRGTWPTTDTIVTKNRTKVLEFFRRAIEKELR